VHLFRLVVLNALLQSDWVVKLHTALQSFLQLANTAFHRFEHLLRLASSIAENQNPLILPQFLPQSFRICLKNLVALFQPVSSVFNLLARTREDSLGPCLEHGQSHGQKI
jgi:hypothetical protein